jgi:hypothetical protein
MAARMEQLHALLSTLRVEDFAVASPALVARLRAGLKKSFDLAAATPGANAGSSASHCRLCRAALARM